MFQYQVNPQVVIGLRFSNLLAKLIVENHFQKVAIVFQTDQNNLVSKSVRKLIRTIHHKTNALCIECKIDKQTNVYCLDQDIDLLISYGTGEIHRIAKKSNLNNTPMYFVETRPGRISSCEKHVDATTYSSKHSFHNVIFNSCHEIKKWSFDDARYFLRDIFLAIHIIISSEDKNDLIVSSVLGGMNEILRAYQQIKLVQGKKRLRNLYVKLVQADFLIKSAHLNTSFNSKFLLQNIFNNQDYQIKNDIKLESLLNEITTFYEHISKMNESCHLFEIDDKFFRTTIEKMYQECNSMNIKKDIQK